jgi:hypothetical protein
MLSLTPCSPGGKQLRSPNSPTSTRNRIPPSTMAPEHSAHAGHRSEVFAAEISTAVPIEGAPPSHQQPLCTEPSRIEMADPRTRPGKTYPSAANRAR